MASRRFPKSSIDTPRLRTALRIHSSSIIDDHRGTNSPVTATLISASHINMGNSTHASRSAVQQA